MRILSLLLLQVEEVPPLKCIQGKLGYLEWNNLESSWLGFVRLFYTYIAKITEGCKNGKTL